MSDLTIISGQSLSMSSREIAELVEKRHDNVKRTIETLAEQGIIPRPQIEDGQKSANGVVEKLFKLDKRSSLIVVAQLCPEFTARIVDRWQELEKMVAQPAIPQTLPEALRLAAEAIEQRDKLAIENQAKTEALAEAAPKIAALDRFSNHQGEHNLRSATKLLGLPEHKLKTWLLMHSWYYRDRGGRLCAHSDKIKTGHLDAIPVEVPRSDGIQVVAHPVITQKGLAKLAELLAKSGLLGDQQKAA